MHVDYQSARCFSIVDNTSVGVLVDGMLFLCGLHQHLHDLKLTLTYSVRQQQYGLGFDLATSLSLFSQVFGLADSAEIAQSQNTKKVVLYQTSLVVQAPTAVLGQVYSTR